MFFRYLFVGISNIALIVLAGYGGGPACSDEVKDEILWQIKGGEPIKPSRPDNPVQFETIGSLDAICFIGDNGDDSNAQQLVADAMLEEGCTQVRIVGDIIYNNGLPDVESDRFFSHFYDYYRTMIEEYDIPFYLVMGNHDYRSDVAEWLTVAQEHRNIIYPNYYYLDMGDDVCFLGLDTNGFFRDEQVYFFSEKLSETAQCRATIAYAHHPYISSGSHGNAEGELKRFLEETVIGHVDLFIAGHDHHLSDEGDIDATRQLISGGGGKNLRGVNNPEIWGEKTFGFLVVTPTGATIDYRFIEVDENGSRVGHTGSVQTQGYRP